MHAAPEKVRTPVAELGAERTSVQLVAAASGARLGQATRVTRVAALATFSTVLARRLYLASAGAGTLIDSPWTASHSGHIRPGLAIWRCQ